MAAFFVQVADDRFAATEHTRGPWDPSYQHAGPPAALLGRAVEARLRPGMRMARLTFDIARQIPIEALTVTCTVRREGRSTMVVEAAAEPYLRCIALAMRTEPGAAPEVAAALPVPLPGPGDGAQPQPFFPTPFDVGYHTAMEIRFSEGSFLSAGPATAWARMRLPLVDGEVPSPLTRVLVAADSGNGISATLDPQRYLFINADLSVHLVRYPVGEWVCLRAVTSIDGTGIGLADTALSDERGQLGRAVQSLLVGERRT